MRTKVADFKQLSWVTPSLAQGVTPRFFQVSTDTDVKRKSLLFRDRTCACDGATRPHAVAVTVATARSARRCRRCVTTVTGQAAGSAVSHLASGAAALDAVDGGWQVAVCTGDPFNK